MMDMVLSTMSSNFNTVNTTPVSVGRVAAGGRERGGDWEGLILLPGPLDLLCLLERQHPLWLALSQRLVQYCHHCLCSGQGIDGVGSI